jgi:hypothetical protein
MKIFDANACMDAFCALCEELVLSELMSVDEAQYWVFEHGYQSANASMVEFSALCDVADSSDLLSAMDCQYWLFERGYLAAKKVLANTAKFEQLELAQFVNPSQKLVEVNLH